MNRLALAGAGAVAVVSVAAVSVATGVVTPPWSSNSDLSDLLEPLVPEEDPQANVTDEHASEEEDLSDLLVPLCPEDGELEDLLVPLVSPYADVPGGGNIAEAYRLEVTYESDGTLEMGMQLRGAEAPLVQGEGEMTSQDSFAGDVVLQNCRTYEGQLAGRFSGTMDTDFEAFGQAERCTAQWSGEQTVEAIGTILSSADAADYVETEPSARYLQMSLRPVGSPRYTDPDDCAEGSDPLTFGGTLVSGEGHPIWTVRLPPPGYGKLEERIEESVEGIGSELWVITLTAISEADASPKIEHIESPMMAESATMDLTVTDAGAKISLTGVASNDQSGCLIGGPDGLLFSYDAEDAVIYLDIPDVESAAGGTDVFSLFIEDYESGAFFEVDPAASAGSGTATVSRGGDAARVDVVATTMDGAEIAMAIDCAELVPFVP